MGRKIIKRQVIKKLSDSNEVHLLTAVKASQRSSLNTYIFSTTMHRKHPETSSFIGVSLGKSNFHQSQFLSFLRSISGHLLEQMEKRKLPFFLQKVIWYNRIYWYHSNPWVFSGAKLSMSMSLQKKKKKKSDSISSMGNVVLMKRTNLRQIKIHLQDA